MNGPVASEHGGVRGMHGHRCLRPRSALPAPGPFAPGHPAPGPLPAPGHPAPGHPAPEPLPAPGPFPAPGLFTPGPFPAPGPLPPPGPTVAPRRLWLVRHGESTWNALGLVQGQVAAPGLTRRGLRQAQRVAARLAGEPVVALWSSDLRRAAHTAAPIGRALGLEVCYDARLRERSLGAAEGGPSALLGPDRLGIDGERVVDADAAPDGGESVRQLFDRASSFVRRLVASHGDGDLVLVCHGGVLCVVLAWLDGVGPDGMAWPPVANGLAVCRALELPGRAAEPPDGGGVLPTPGAGRDRRCRQEDGGDPA